MSKILNWVKTNPTISLAILTVYLYACTFQYEEGFLDTFDISPTYISIDFNIMLLDVFKIIEIITSVILLYEIGKFSLLKIIPKYSIYEEIVKIICRMVAGVLFAYLALPIPNAFIKYYAIASLIFLSIFLIVVFTPWFFKRFKENAEKSLPIKPYSGYFKYFILIFIVSLPAFLLNILGNGISSKITSLPMINDTSNLLVIRRYGDELVCKKLDKDLKRFKNETYVIKISDHAISLIDYNIGSTIYLNRFYPTQSQEKLRLGPAPSKKLQPIHPMAEPLNSCSQKISF